MTNLVAIFANANRLDEAATYGHELIELLSKLAQENPNRSEFVYGLAASLNIVASVLGKLEHKDLAYEYFDRSRSVYGELIQENSGVETYRIGIANSCYSKADLALLKSDWQQAIEAYSQAIETIRNLLARAY